MLNGPPARYGLARAKANRQTALAGIEGPAFAPAEPDDGRKKLDWKSHYPWQARLWIAIEATYLLVLLVGTPLLLLLVWRGSFRSTFDLSRDQYSSFRTWAEAWGGGVLGGTALSVKWLYHATARGLWHADRRLWRLFTPHLSGALAFGLLALITSGIFDILDREKLRSPAAIVSFAFVIGLFADNATARLALFADSLFGTTRRFRDDHHDSRHHE